ncbi:hypothetical protein [Gordonia terrae]|uniref:hypothetical protein n=1 Tax=Gordonia terrae TaxID=2055 RepID=UPI003F6D4EC2
MPFVARPLAPQGTGRPPLATQGTGRPPLAPQGTGGHTTARAGDPKVTGPCRLLA